MVLLKINTVKVSDTKPFQTWGYNLNQGFLAISSSHRYRRRYRRKYVSEVHKMYVRIIWGHALQEKHSRNIVLDHYTFSCQ